MPNPRLPDEVTRAVAIQWGRDPNQRAKEVHGVVEALGYRVSIRKVQMVIKDLKDQGGGHYVEEFWFPWTQPGETNEETAHILELQRIWMSSFKRSLYVHEAHWAARTYPALRSTNLVYQAILVAIYGQREFAARNTNAAPLTYDLDCLLAYKPWLSVQRWIEYDNAVGDHLIPPLVYALVVTDLDAFSETWLEADTDGGLKDRINGDGESVLLSTDALFMLLAAPNPWQYLQSRVSPIEWSLATVTERYGGKYGSMATQVADMIFDGFHVMLTAPARARVFERVFQE